MQSISIDQGVNHIIQTYQKSTRVEKQRGKAWYRVARKEIAQLAKNEGLSVILTTGLVALLSPNQAWSRNIDIASKLIKAWKISPSLSNRDKLVISGYGANKAKAWSLLTLAPVWASKISQACKGPKVNAFFHNLLNNKNNHTATIDGHARNIFYNSRVGLTSKDLSIGKKEFQNIQKAYSIATDQLQTIAPKLSVNQLQAITWITWRRMHNINI